jgi:hypothetical protein
MENINNMINDIEARRRSLVFKTEIAREKADFKDILKDLGKNSFEAGTKILLEAPFEVFSKSMKAIYNKNMEQRL